MPTAKEDADHFLKRALAAVLKLDPSREKSIVITKIDEALLWLHREA